MVMVNHKKEWSAGTYFNVDGTCKHATWKKPSSKGYMVYDSVYIKYLKQGNP